MIFAGIDVGAQSIKLVILRDGDILCAEILVTEEEGGVASQHIMQEALASLDLSLADISCTVATGAGRDTVAFADVRRSEQLCHARGAYWLFPSARTVLDIGAEGIRAMKLNGQGRLEDFAINSKCAAGTGAFLEAMTQIVEMPVSEMGILAAKAKKRAKISSYCAVFAESEVISNIHRGVSTERVVAGIHESVVDRLIEILNRVSIREDVVVTGGVALNVGIIKGLERRVGLEMKVPANPQLVGALGAALIGQDIVTKKGQ